MVFRPLPDSEPSHRFPTTGVSGTPRRPGQGQAGTYSGQGGDTMFTVGSFLRRVREDDRGAATAEYAIATLAAVGFAGLLVVVLRSEEVRGMLSDLVRHALSIP